MNSSASIEGRNTHMHAKLQNFIIASHKTSVHEPPRDPNAQQEPEA
jgi:hypothetical protein